MADKMNILIVGDNPDSLAAVEAGLGDAQLAIHKALSGKEALELMQEIGFAVVILDAGIAGTNGNEVAERMRSSEKTREVPILFITEYDKERQDIFRRYASGPVDYLFKPIDPAILKSKVRIFSELHRQRKTIEAQLRLLEEKNQDLEQFAYVASHDLREPLRVVTLYLELLARRYQGKLDEKADTFIHYARNGAERMDKLIKGLLQYSRVNTSDETFSEVDMNQVFEEAVASLSGSIRACGAVISKDDLPSLSGAYPLLVQLLENLLSNAVKFGKPGSGSQGPRLSR